MKKYILLVLISSLFIQCSRKMVPVTADMSPEERAFTTTCQKCHKLPKTEKHTVEEWPNTVNRMQKKANFSDEQKTQILTFLTTHAKK